MHIVIKKKKKKIVQVNISYILRTEEWILIKILKH